MKAEHEVREALDIQQRRKKSIQMRRLKGRLAIARKKAMQRTANMDRLKQRARKAARKAVFMKFSKGKSKDELPYPRRQEIEKRVDKMKKRVERIARKLLPKVRQMEKDRKRKAKGSDE